MILVPPQRDLILVPPFKGLLIFSVVILLLALFLVEVVVLVVWVEEMMLAAEIVLMRVVGVPFRDMYTLLHSLFAVLHLACVDCI